MADGILGLGTGNSVELSQALIDKLKKAESKARIDPLTKQIDKITSVEKGKEGEEYVFTEIQKKVSDLLDTAKLFDLYNDDHTNVFEKLNASSTGNSAIFSVDDTSMLQAGTQNISVAQVATRDAYQSTRIVDKTAKLTGDITITVNGKPQLISAKGLSYEDLAKKINEDPDVTASIENVGPDPVDPTKNPGQFKLIITSAKTGEINKIGISSNVSGLSFTQTVVAKDMIATLNGVKYKLPSNQMQMADGLKINVVSIGKSAVSISKSTDSIVPSAKKLVQQYNDLVKFVSDQRYDKDSPLSDDDTFKQMDDSIKNIFFGAYGKNPKTSPLSLFNYGFSIQKDGSMSLDAAKFSKALSDHPDDVKSLFVGVAEAEGVGTKLKAYIDQLNYPDGLLTQYDKNMHTRLTKLQADKTKAQKQLDDKYSQMAQRFAAYTAIISRMQSSFGGLQMMIAQSTAKQ